MEYEARPYGTVQVPKSVIDYAIIGRQSAIDRCDRLGLNDEPSKPAKERTDSFDFGSGATGESSLGGVLNFAIGVALLWGAYYINQLNWLTGGMAVLGTLACASGIRDTIATIVAIVKGLLLLAVFGVVLFGIVKVIGSNGNSAPSTAPASNIAQKSDTDFPTNSISKKPIEKRAYQTAIVTVDNLRLRACPATTCTIVAVMQKGLKVQALQPSNSSPGWLEIQASDAGENSFHGYASSDSIKF